MNEEQRKAHILKEVNRLYGDVKVPKRSGNPDYTKWFVRIHVKRFALPTSYTILLFLGPPPPLPSMWRKSPNFVGSHSEFLISDPAKCGNCESQLDTVSESFVDLTETLSEILGPLHIVAERLIETHIKNNIHWRIQQVSFCDR
jgi:tyrosinase